MLCYNPVDNIDIETITQDINRTGHSKIIIFNELEWELSQLTPEFIQNLKDKNVDLEIIFGSFYDEYYDQYIERLGIDLSKLTFWKTFWINWTEMCLRSVCDYRRYEVDTNFKYPFICLNNKNHIHRAAVIDHLTKYNLIDKGVVTWHKFSNACHGYNFKYYDDSIRIIDDDFTVKLDSFLIPRQWHESFLHIVGEATIHAQFITEKTIIPMLMKKPFVSIGKKGFNNCLKSLGFKLYDEIIDYSFDSCEDVAARADKLCKSVSDIGNNYAELYELIRPKIEFNYNRCLDIIKDKSFIPQQIINRVNSMNSLGYIQMKTDPRYQHMVEQLND